MLLMPLRDSVVHRMKTKAVGSMCHNVLLNENKEDFLDSVIGILSDLKYFSWEPDN